MASRAFSFCKRILERISFPVLLLILRATKSGKKEQYAFLKRPMDWSDPDDRARGNYASWVFEHESDKFWSWFPSRPTFAPNARVLDLGSGMGGRLAAYARDLGCEVHGLEIDYHQAAESVKFIKHLGLHAPVVQADATFAPYKDNTFDAVLSYDVFEHVHDLASTLRECARILKPGGSLWAVFPPYYHPKGPHLHRSSAVWLHLFWSERAIWNAVNVLWGDRAELHKPYGREVSTAINGITIREARALIEQSPLTVKWWHLAPLLPEGRSRFLVSYPYFAPLAIMLRIGPCLPLLREALTHRICVVLEKPHP